MEPALKKICHTKLNLTISPQKSWLETVGLMEISDKIDLDDLIKKSSINWDMTKYANRLSATFWRNQKMQLEAYRALQTPGGVVTILNTRRHPWGRVFPVKMLGFTAFQKKTRNVLMGKIYSDLDIKNCHYEICRQVCESSGIPCVEISNFIDNRESIYNDLTIRYGVDVSVLKGLFLRLLYLGKFEGWAIEHGILQKATSQIIKLAKELKCIAEIIYSKNPELVSYVDTLNGRNNKLATLLSYYLQEYELRVMSSVIRYLHDETDVLDKEETGKFCSYQYDGIQLLTKNINAFDGGITALLIKIENVGYMKTGLKLTWIEKSIV